MTDTQWIWQVVLPLFYVAALATMLWVVFRGRGPRRFGPRVYLPRHLTPTQEKQIARFLYQGNRIWAEHLYAEMTGASSDEAAYAIEHWTERQASARLTADQARRLVRSRKSRTARFATSGRSSGSR